MKPDIASQIRLCRIYVGMDGLCSYLERNFNINYGWGRPGIVFAAKIDVE